MGAATSRIFTAYWSLEELVPDGLTNPDAMCFAEVTAAQFTYDELIDEAGPSEDRAIEAGDLSAAECLGPG